MCVCACVCVCVCVCVWKYKINLWPFVCKIIPTLVFWSFSFFSFFFFEEIFYFLYWSYKKRTNKHKKLFLFVVRPTNRASLAQGLFKVGPGAGPELRHARRLQKCLKPRRHFPKKRRLRPQGINLTPSMRVRTWGHPSKARRGSAA